MLRLVQVPAGTHICIIRQPKIRAGRLFIQRFLCLEISMSLWLTDLVRGQKNRGLIRLDWHMPSGSLKSMCFLNGTRQWLWFGVLNQINLNMRPGLVRYYLTVPSGKRMASLGISSGGLRKLDGRKIRMSQSFQTMAIRPSLKLSILNYW